MKEDESNCRQRRKDALRPFTVQDGTEWRSRCLPLYLGSKKNEAAGMLPKPSKTMLD